MRLVVVILLGVEALQVGLTHFSVWIVKRNPGLKGVGEAFLDAIPLDLLSFVVLLDLLVYQFLCFIQFLDRNTSCSV